MARDAVTEIAIKNPIAREAFIRWWRTMEAEGYQYGFEALCNVWVGFDDGRAGLAWKVLEIVEAEIGGSLATEHNASVRQVRDALRELFQKRESMSNKPDAPAPLTQPEGEQEPQLPERIWIDTVDGRRIGHEAYDGPNQFGKSVGYVSADAAAAPSPSAIAAPKDDEFEYCPTCGGELDTGWECKKCGRDWRASAVVDEVQRRMDQVVEAAVEWHQAGREGGEWFDAAEKLSAAIESLLELRGKPEFAEPVTTTRSARAAAEEIVDLFAFAAAVAHNNNFMLPRQDERRIAAIISKHFPTAAIEAGGDEEMDYERGAQWGIDHAQSEYFRGASDLHSRVVSALRETKENFIAINRALEIIDAAAPVGLDENPLLPIVAKAAKEPCRYHAHGCPVNQPDESVWCAPCAARWSTDAIIAGVAMQSTDFAPVAATDADEGERTRCASCKHPFCKNCNDVSECCKCGTEQPPRSVVERLDQHEHVYVVPGVLGGVTPLVSRTRIGVHHVLTYLYNGNSIEHIADTYRLSPEAIKDAIAFAQEVYDDAVSAALRTPEGEGK